MCETTMSVVVIKMGFLVSILTKGDKAGRLGRQVLNMNA